MQRKHNRANIINTLYDDFGGKVPDDVIEASLIKIGFITAVSRGWLHQKFIKEELSAKECAALAGVSLGTIQGYIKKYDLQKKNYGITNGNNGAHRRMIWRRKIADAQPNAKRVKVFNAKSGEYMMTCSSIVATSRELGLAREHVRDCLNPNKQRKTAAGYKFEFA